MSTHRLDRVPFSGIIKIRDMMYGVKDPFRLDQGDVSFDAPDSVKAGMRRAIDENRTHYVQTNGLPRLRELLVEKLRRKNHIPIDDPEEVIVTNGGIHGVFITCQSLLEPGDEVIVPDPEWPPSVGNILAAEGVPVGCPLHESIGWRYDFDQLASLITPRTRAIYLNSPHNPTGGVLTRADLERIVALAAAHDLWVISDEAYEDVIFGDQVHVSPASLPGMYDRTVTIYTFSKTFAITGLRLGYVAAKDPVIRERMRKAAFYTATNVSSIVQHGGIAGLEGPQDFVEQFRQELEARRDFFYRGIAEMEPRIFSGEPPLGAFYAFLKIDRDALATAAPDLATDTGSISWALTSHLIERARVGCVPGVDFGPTGEGYIRFCFARERHEVAGALDSMQRVFAAPVRG